MECPTAATTPSPATDFARTVKDAADIVKIIGEYVRLDKAGAQNYRGLCPFHKEKTPSFSVHATQRFYHCFGCHESGDVFTFVQKLENVSFPEAVRVVAGKAGVPLPKRSFSGPEEAKEARQRAQLLEMHEVAAAWFQQQSADGGGCAGAGVSDVARFAGEGAGDICDWLCAGFVHRAAGFAQIQI